VAYFATAFVVGSYSALQSRDLSWDIVFEVAGRWLHLPGVALFGFVVLLTIIVIVGLPLDSVLRRVRWTSVVSYGAAGTVAGATLGLGIAAVLPPGVFVTSDSPVPLTAWDRLMPFIELGTLGAFMGGLAATVFRCAVLRQQVD
jgi:hypothetical protein